ncbi:MULTISPECIES: immunity protein YezG family protein [unclassified Pedobacter]|jgi:hypothetical protein|uniref:immunity protein YezG family protein n=1 Tax=Pedobacter TaxID=84567 RepID=UPI000B4B4A59|nr:MULTISPECIES: immunity protein YezG family protein [unclassified Pedobacter]MCX2429261.1 hypothetical protein [Pedobacter sp. GR22-10]MCX2583692.1 hypothetical protein [Pedobacter sp. MR22-3]OWK71090.1 hypothetical protein CBW18_08405 [Pedobacter sp. AJM]
MTVDEIYEAIAKEILNVINDDWDKACLEFEFVGEGVVGYTGDYVNDNNKKDIEVENIDDDVTDWLSQLHEITTEGGNNKWNRAIFTLFSTGKFDMEFIWDQELNDEIERLSKE